MDAYDPAFVETIDYILLNSDDDIKMKNALFFLDAQSKKKRITIYQTIYKLFQKDILEERAIQWTKIISSYKP